VYDLNVVPNILKVFFFFLAFSRGQTGSAFFVSLSISPKVIALVLATKTEVDALRTQPLLFLQQGKFQADILPV
jgi:hypothetical protein